MSQPLDVDAVVPAGRRRQQVYRARRVAEGYRDLQVFIHPWALERLHELAVEAGSLGKALEAIVLAHDPEKATDE